VTVIRRRTRVDSRNDCLHLLPELAAYANAAEKRIFNETKNA
jgi:hypothetical protein